MNVTDINQPGTKFWRLYQEARRRDGILDNPDYVPFWFLEKLARRRLEAARFAVEQVGAPGGEAAWKALGALIETLFSGALEEREQLVLGILGADDEEPECGDRVELCSACKRELGSTETCDRCLGARDASWIGSSFDALLKAPRSDRSPRIALTGVLYEAIRAGHIKEWQTRLPRVIQFWGAERPLRVGQLAYSLAAAQAYLALKEKS